MRADALLAGFFAFVFCAIVSKLRATQYNNYVLLADAFLHGHAWITWPGPYIDALEYEGKRYVIEAPVPAILLMPAVALFGTSANQTLLTEILAGVAVATAWELVKRFGGSWSAGAWLCGFLFFGTDLLWCAVCGGVWFTAHVSALAFTLLALYELSQRRRGWKVAFFAACAAGSRFSLVLAIPVYLAFLATDPEVEKRSRRIIDFCVMLVPFALLWVAYNEARWHVPYDIGYTEWYHRDPIGRPTGSPFSLAYLNYELYSFFLLGPQWVKGFPYAVPTFNGLALTWTSPALALAFFARGDRRWIAAMWCAAVLVAIPNVLYYTNGSIQFGMRHALDFEAFLFALMAASAQPRLSRVGILLCAYSILVGIWGIWYWITFYQLV